MAAVAALPMLGLMVLPLLFAQPSGVDVEVEMDELDEEIPAVALQAYVAAAASQTEQDPSCTPSWALLAGIGKVETDHGRFGNGFPDTAGTVVPPVFGVVLDGSTPGTRAIRDTDGGRLDGDAHWDRAVGPMQFIPSTWVLWARDVDGDGQADPQNLFDAAGAAAALLCDAARTDITTTEGMRQAILAYNRSVEYVQQVTAWMTRYLGEVPDPGAVTSDGWTNPAPTYSHVSSPYGYRTHPITGIRRLHAGIDLACGTNQPIVAAAGGVVTAARGEGGAGMVIWLEHEGGYRTRYLHLALRSFVVAPGDLVRAGQRIAGCGSTGMSTGPHLHFEVYPPGGSTIDPGPFMAERGVVF